MKKTILFYYAAFLLLSVFLLGCGSWFAHKNEQTGPQTIAQEDLQNTSLGQVPKPTFVYDSLYKKYCFPYLPMDSKRLRDVTEKVTTTDTIVYAGRQRFFKPNSVCMDTMEFLQTFRTDLGLGPDDELRPSKHHVQFAQYYKGVKVGSAGLTVVYKDACLTELYGGLILNLNVNIKPTLSPIAALQSYIEKYATPQDTAKIYATIKYYSEHPYKITHDNFNITAGRSNDSRFKALYSKGWLKSDTTDTSYSIVYKHIVPIHGKEYYVYIDAHSGLVKNTQDYLTHASAGVMACQTGDVHTEYGGYGGFTPLTPQTYDVGGAYRTIENIQNGANYVLETDNTCPQPNIQLRTVNEFLNPPASGSAINNPSNNWLNNTSYNRHATLFWAVQQVYNYYDTKHSIIGWYNNTTGAAQPIKIAVAYPQASPAPYLAWGPNLNLGDGISCIRVADPNSTSLTIVQDDFGNIIQGGASWGNLASIDLIGHEYTHAIDHYSGLNLYQWLPAFGDADYEKKVRKKARFLESLCDIMGACIEHNIIGSYDWLFMHDLTNGKKLQRSFKYPNDFSYHIVEDCAGATKTYDLGQPSYYNQLSYYDNGSCEDDHYVNGGVLNHWFYLLVKGNQPNGTTINGTTYYVDAIGGIGQDSVAKAENIVYDVFMNNNTPSFMRFNPETDDFPEVCAKTILAANALYPPNAGNVCSPEVRAVKKAWEAVGVPCPLPAGVTCALCPQNDPDNALCDNHLPYLQSMTAYENSGSGNIQVAHQQWVQSGTDLCFNDIMPTGYADITIGNQLEIVVTASEPLSSLNLDKIALGSVQYNISAGGTPLSLISVTPSADQTIWTFMLEQTGNIYSNLYVTNHNNSYRCYFTGTDLAGNALQTLQNTPNYNSQTNCLPLADLPTKLPDNTWSAQYDGTDTQFMLNFDACPNLIFNYAAGPTPQHANPANSLLIMPSDGQNANSYTLIDNNTGQIIVENFPVITPSDNYYDVWTAAENSPYNAINANYFCTIGLLPDNYTLIVNMSGCQKILADNNPSLDVCSGNDLIINNIQKANSTSHPAYTEVSIEFDFIAPNPTDIYTLSIATGSVSYYWTPITENSSYLDIYLLNSEVTPTINGQSIPTPWAYSVIDENNCLVSSGLLDNTMILVDINAPDCGQIATPQFTQTSNPPAAACLEQLICVSYTVSCSQSLAVEISRPDAQHTFEQHYIAMPVGGYREQIGTVCFTLNDPQAAGTTQAIDVIASNYASPNCQTTEIYTWLFEIPPLPPTLTFAAQDIIPALKGCDGEVWQEGSVAIMPANYTGTCKPPFMVNGTNNPTQPVLADGMNYYEVTYQGQTQTVEVNIPAADPADTRTDDLSITAQTMPATRYCYGGDHGGPCGCWINECDGQIDVSVTGGSDQYSYQWADCSSGCQPIMTDSPNFDPCCAQRNGLCYGCYRLTVTDTETGCQAARTVNVGVQLPDGRVLYYVCTNGITDDQSTIAEAANIATLDPELQLYPSVFDVLTNVKYEVKEDSYVTIRVYNLQGVPIETLVNDEYKAPGEYTLSNEGNDYSNGLYIFVLETCDKVEGKIGVKY